MTLYHLTLLMFLPATLRGADEPVIAFIKDTHVFVAAEDGTAVRQLDADPRQKGHLAWDKYGKRLSYLVASTADELSRLVTIDLEGKRVTEAAVRARTDPPTFGMRFVEGVSWTAAGKARLWGSINPSLCEMFDLDPDTGEESNWQGGSCGSFAVAPDGKHIAAIGPAYQFTPDDKHFDFLKVDNKEDVYPDVHDPRRIEVAAGPVWSPDSQKIAIIEERKIGGEAAIVIVTLAGTFTRIPVSRSVLDHRSLAWVGTKVVVGHRTADELQIDSATKRVGSVTADVLDEVDRRSVARIALDARRKEIEATVKKLGGREPIDLIAEENSLR